MVRSRSCPSRRNVLGNVLLTLGAALLFGAVAAAAQPRYPARASEPVLLPGTVRDAQVSLRKLGYGLRVTGKADRATIRAIKRYQRKNFLFPTGVLNVETVNTLNYEPNVSVRTEQGRLFQRGPHGEAPW